MDVFLYFYIFKFRFNIYPIKNLKIKNEIHNMKIINIMNIYIYIYMKTVLLKILVPIYLFIRLLIIICEYIFILKTNLF